MDVKNTNMVNSFFLKIKPYLWLLIPILLSVFFGILVSLFMGQGDGQLPPSDSSPKTTTEPPSSMINTITNGGINEVWPTGFEDFYGDLDASGLENVQSAQSLPDGTKKYTAASSNPSRPNIVITKGDLTIYQRKVPEPEADIPLQNFIEQFGQPERIIEGPEFYEFGTTSEYVFAKNGVSIVVNNQDSQVLEQLFFRPTTVDDYLSSFGNDGSPRI